MRRNVRQILYALLLGVGIPWIVLSFVVLLSENTRLRQQSVQEDDSTPDCTVLHWDEAPVSICRKNGKIQSYEMDDYLTQVVLAEMPAYFEPEALKAQAVAARTYVYRMLQDPQKHGYGTVCDDSTCCQAFIDTQIYLASCGTQADVEKVRNAVADTSGEVLCYNGKLIEAVYFSCSGGNTEDAAAVWGRDIPYLQATASPGEENAQTYRQSSYYSRSELEKILGIILPASAETWFSDFTYTRGGGIAEVNVGGVRFSGTYLRSLLGLRSTRFSVEPDTDGVHITTYGYGHRVGMSQYGADAMAADGKTYREILLYYYTGTEILQYSQLEGK